MSATPPPTAKRAASESLSPEVEHASKRVKEDPSSEDVRDEREPIEVDDKNGDSKEDTNGDSGEKMAKASAEG
jgi:hypothetical protein